MGVLQELSTASGITVYAETQELFKINPSRLAELVLQDLLLVSPRVDPPAQASIGLYQALWGTADGGARSAGGSILA